MFPDKSTRRGGSPRDLIPHRRSIHCISFHPRPPEFDRPEDAKRPLASFDTRGRLTIDADRRVVSEGRLRVVLAG